jgi:hypothetical protein
MAARLSTARVELPLRRPCPEWRDPDATLVALELSAHIADIAGVSDTLEQ